MNQRAKKDVINDSDSDFEVEPKKGKKRKYPHTTNIYSLASQPYFPHARKILRGREERLVTLARFSYQSGMLIATPLSHDKFKLDPCIYVCTMYMRIRGGRTRRTHC